MRDRTSTGTRTSTSTSTSTGTVESGTPERTRASGWARVGEAARRRLSFVHLVVAIMLLGAVARVVQYLSGRSFWLDESSIVLALREKSLSEILDPLDLAQGGPVSFLVVQKAMADAFGDGELVMRLAPLVMGLLALPLAYLLARASLAREASLVALALVAFSESAIYYSAEAKQYSGDVLVAMGLLYLAIVASRARTTRALLALALAGIAAPWISHPSLFFLVAIGAVLLAQAAHERDGRRLRLLGGAAAGWALSALAVYWLNVSRLDDVQELATGAGSELVPSGPLDVGWAERVLDSLNAALGFPRTLAWFGAVLLVLGAISMHRRRAYAVLALVALPLVITLLASLARLYPVGGRFLLFLIPSMALLVAEGAWWIVTATRARAPAIGIVVLIALIAPALARTVVVTAAPRDRQEIETVLDHVRDRLRPGDRVYAADETRNALAIYGPRYGFEPGDVLVDAPGDRLADMVARADRLQGRVWVIVSHYRDLDGLPVDAALRAAFERSGRRLDHVEAVGASADLYQLPTTPP